MDVARYKPAHTHDASLHTDVHIHVRRQMMKEAETKKPTCSPLLLLCSALSLMNFSCCTTATLSEVTKLRRRGKNLIRLCSTLSCTKLQRSLSENKFPVSQCPVSLSSLSGWGVTTGRRPTTNTKTTSQHEQLDGTEAWPAQRKYVVGILVLWPSTASHMEHFQ